MTTANYFTTKTRTDGSEFVCLTDNAPEWVTDTVYDCHDITGDSPDDWTYRTIAHIFDLMRSEPQLGPWEIAETLTEHTYHDLYTWATPTRWAFIDDVASDYGIDKDAGIDYRIQVGQSAQISRMAETIIQAIEDNTKQED